MVVSPSPERNLKGGSKFIDSPFSACFTGNMFLLCAMYMLYYTYHLLWGGGLGYFILANTDLTLGQSKKKMGPRGGPSPLLLFFGAWVLVGRW